MEAVKKTKKPIPVIKEKPQAPKLEEVVLAPTATIEPEDQLDDIMPEDFPTEKELQSKPDRYFEAIGRRKTAVARVRLFTRGEKQFVINGKDYQQYFPLKGDQETSTASMKKMKFLDKFKVTVIV